MNERQVEVLQAQQQQMSGHSALVAAQFGDGLPYERLRYLERARYHMQRSAEEALAVGRCLIVMKENEPHGEWLNLLEQLGIERTVAARLAQAALKFGQLEKPGKLIEAAKSKSKLFELMLLDDDDLEALNEGGSVAGLELDDIERMTARELRKALREARADKEALAKVLTDKNAKLDELAHALAKKPLVVVLPPDEKSKELRAEVSALAFEAEADITGKLREGLRKMREHEEETGLDHRAWQAGLVRHLENLLAGLRSEFDIPDDAEMGGQIPDWMTAQQADIDALVQDNLPAQEH